MAGNPAQLFASAMAVAGRTESTVVQVAPDCENDLIREMGIFGWNLQGRQEIHEERESLGKEAVFSDRYIIKTKISHYVKVSLVRNLALPNLDKVRRLEAEYRSLPYPRFAGAKSYLWPILILLLAVYGGSRGQPGDAQNALILGALAGIWLAIKIALFLNRTKIRAETEQRRQELAAQAEALLRLPGEVAA